MVSSGFILQVELTGFANGLDFKRKRAIKEDCQVGQSRGRDDITTKIGKMTKGTGVLRENRCSV